MVYTDGVHMIGSSIEELHLFAKQIDLNKCYYRNPRKKRHPHYDLMNDKIRKMAINYGAKLVSNKEIIILCREFYGERVK